MAGDLGKIGSEGFHLIDNYYAPCKCKNNVYRHRGVGTNPTTNTRQGRFGAHHHHHQGHINNNNIMMREDNEGVIINNREAAMKYNGINVESYHHHHKLNHSDLPKTRWGKIFFFKR